MSSVPSLLRFPVRNPSASLLLVQLLGVVLYPFMEDTPTGRTLFGAFGLVVLGTTLRMVRRSPAETRVGIVLAVLVVALSVLNRLTPRSALVVAIAGLNAVFYFYAAGALISYMLQDQVATKDELFAAGATFTVLAWAFAHLFGACQVLIPGSFAGSAGTETAQSWMELLFLSFTTLSSVGLGDIVPRASFARALVMLEEFAGLMYIALVVSRLISMTSSNRDRS